MPALLKAFLEQVMRPGIALEYRERGFPRGLFAERSARLVVMLARLEPLSAAALEVSGGRSGVPKLVRSGRNPQPRGAGAVKAFMSATGSTIARLRMIAPPMGHTRPLFLAGKAQMTNAGLQNNNQWGYRWATVRFREYVSSI